ncbi:MAG: NAD(P)-binding protein [Syntrophaceae bacterium]|nr:NAD(P)-binding protein [Syntrophaceae bacterium]
MATLGKEDDMANYQVIVIGSGAGGLSAALSLTRKGLSVLLLEAMPSLGGYLNPFRRKQYKFDTGLYYLGQLGKGEPFWNLLDALGIADKIGFVELDPGGIDRYVFPDFVEYATPLTNEYWVNAVKDGCFGPEQTPDQVGPGRFSRFTAGIEGLFLVGAGTIAGGVMPCVASGVLAGAKAASFLGLKL